MSISELQPDVIPWLKISYGFQQAAISGIGQGIASAENGLRVKVHQVLLQGLQLPGLAIQLLTHGLLQPPLPLL